MRKILVVLLLLVTLAALLAGITLSVQAIDVDMDTLLEGDLNSDGKINLVDANAFKSNYPCFASCDPEDGDFDRNGIINLIDANLFKGNYPKFTINEV